MELIKKIKQAETQAGQIIEQAKADSVKQSQQAAEKQAQALVEAEQKRKKTIAEAVSTANSKALTDIEGLKAQAAQARQQLRDSVADKISGAVAKVVDYLKG